MGLISGSEPPIDICCANKEGRKERGFLAHAPSVPLSLPVHILYFTSLLPQPWEGGIVPISQKRRLKSEDRQARRPVT